MNSYNSKIYISLLIFSIFLIGTFIVLDKVIFNNQLKENSLNIAFNKSLEREHVFQDFFVEAEYHINAIRNSTLFNKYLISKNVEDTQCIFLSIARNNRRIMQIRYIDKTGKEKIKIERKSQNSQPKVIAKKLLQDKSKRNYFTNLKNNNLETLWFSDIDLNVEHGDLEIPYKPTVRAILPVSNEQEFDGIIIINYFMEEFLNEFIITGIFDVILFNNKLQTLIHPEHDKSWSAYNKDNYQISDNFSGVHKGINKESYLGEDFFIRKLKLPVNTDLYALFKVKEPYIKKQTNIANQRILIIALSSLLFSALISILLTRIINILVSDIETRKQLQEVLKQKNNQLAKISITDSLTQAYNRRYFNEIMETLINSAKRDNKQINFVMIDIDYFKQYNDTFGHDKGDEVLVKVSTTMKKHLKRAGDYCFRLGGEEFGVFFNAKEKQSAIDFVENLRKAFLELKIEAGYKTTNEYVSASFGLVSRPSNEIDCVKTLYKEADNLLYRAKHEGRNRVFTN